MRIISVCVLQEIKINNKTLHTLPLEQFASGSIFTSRFLPAITQPEQQVEQIGRIHHMDKHLRLYAAATACSDSSMFTFYCALYRFCCYQN